MLVGIGKKSAGADLRSALAECHDRIRSFSALACRLAGPMAMDARPEEVAEAAEAVRRYFVVALPLHVADEEQTLMPLLAGRDAAVDAAFAKMAGEHAEHEPAIAALVETCERLAGDPAELPRVRQRLEAIAVPLEAALRAHLALEEETIFPALERLLSTAERDDVRAAMRARRA
jgi:hemerythrin-like domain-containing protein